jgi:signal peptidase
VRRLRRIASTVLLAAVAAVAAAVVVVPAVSGASTFTITGRSMEPTIPLGSVVVTRPVAAADIRIGDAVTYQISSGRPEVATHRVTGVVFTGDGPSFVTRGDANAAADAETIVAEQVRGVVWYAVPLVGWVNALLTPAVRAWVVPVVVAGLCAYGGWALVSGLRERRRPRPAAARV